ncbi:hypothetical protein [Psychroserpens algicola]|uniref:Uncharacterized protein n=1 Tax=Psychroserpens algicola TaxID=1719034 RepID=A0ABT0HDX8_9FLAO|nr:hypothetical protein [Psychroserpens algicola]MCK8482259.1 hypothetical protein [Psychroserpens algicola]
MILLLIFGISLIQFLLNYLSYKKFKDKSISAFILIVILIGYYFVFPSFFLPEPNEDGINCGLPILGIILASWFFGTFAGITTHIVWLYWKPKLIRT